MSAIESTMRPSGSPNPRSATMKRRLGRRLRGQPENRAHVERAQNLAAQIDQPRNARAARRARAADG